MTTDKIHCNSILYTPDGKYLTVDVNKFYLNNPINKAEYLKIALKILPQDIIDTHDLISKQCNGYIYVIIKKGMYILVQDRIITHEALKEHLNPYGHALEKPHKYYGQTQIDK